MLRKKLFDDLAVFFTENRTGDIKQFAARFEQRPESLQYRDLLLGEAL